MYLQTEKTFFLLVLNLLFNFSKIEERNNHGRDKKKNGSLRFKNQIPVTIFVTSLK